MQQTIEALKKFYESNKSTIDSIFKKYGDKAIPVIIEMIKNPETNYTLYEDAIDSMSVNQLLDSAKSDFQDALRKKENFNIFLKNTGEIVGILSKAIISKILPI